MHNFEKFLKDSLKLGATEIRLVPRIDDVTRKVRFYAHPQDVQGETFDGEVSGKHIRMMQDKASK